MVEAVLHRLTSNGTLLGLLGAVPGDTHITPSSAPLPTAGQATISYTVRPMTSGDVNQSSIEFRVSAKEYALAYTVAMILQAILDTGDLGIGWWYGGTNVLSMNLNGGGEQELEGANVFQQFRTFTVRWR